MKQRPISVFLLAVALAGLAPAKGRAQTSLGPEAVEVGASDEREALGVAGLELLLQPSYELRADEGSDAGGFRLRRARLGVRGTLSRGMLAYGVSIDALAGGVAALPESGPGAELREGHGDEVPPLVDAFLSLTFEQVGLELKLGRFIPSWGLSMPAPAREVGVAGYPLYVLDGRAALGHFRKLGFEARVQLVEVLAVGGGMYGAGRNVLYPRDSGVDALVFIDLFPLEELQLRGAWMFATARPPEGGAAEGTEPGSELSGVLELSAAWSVFEVEAGAAIGLNEQKMGEAAVDALSYGVFGRASVEIIPDVLGLQGGADWWEPSDRIADDGHARLVFGPFLKVEHLGLEMEAVYEENIYGSRRAACLAAFDAGACDLDPLTVDRRRGALLLLLTFAFRSHPEIG